MEDVQIQIRNYDQHHCCLTQSSIIPFVQSLHFISFDVNEIQSIQSEDWDKIRIYCQFQCHIRIFVVMMATKLKMIVKIECDKIFENETNDGKFIDETEY
jgi:hypothetical protein